MKTHFTTKIGLKDFSDLNKFQNPPLHQPGDVQCFYKCGESNHFWTENKKEIH